MLIFILSLLLHIFCCFLISYASDEPKALSQMLDNTFSIYFRAPSIDDLDENIDNIYKIGYIRDVILPAEHFYCLKKSLKDCSDRNSGGDLGFAMVTLSISTFLIILQSFRKLDFISSKPLSFFISLAIAILLSVIVNLIYNKTKYFRPYEFNRSLSELKRDYEIEARNKYDHFELPENIRFNNFLISQFTAYIEKNTHTMHIRYALQKTLFYISGAIYILFFFRIPNL